MKNYLLIFSAFAMFFMFSCTQDEVAEDSVEILSLSDYEARGKNGTTGNGGPSGAHYNLNIIGVPKNKTADMDGNNGHRIFMPLEGRAKILLSEGAFGVLDANGTDNDGAAFSLPAPGNYEIMARPLGTPGGQSITTTCATYEGEEVCSLENVISMRTKGGSKFTNITKELTSIDAFFRDINGDGIIDEADTETVNLFDDDLQDYFWNYDNQGLRVLQLRFYEI